jgi:hypothetical protein
VLARIPAAQRHLYLNRPRRPLIQPGRSNGPRAERYHGTVILDPARVGRDAGRIAEEVVTHLAGLVGSSVRVTLEIETC